VIDNFCNDFSTRNMGAYEQMFYKLIQMRFECKKPTIIISNFSIEQLTKLVTKIDQKNREHFISFFEKLKKACANQTYFVQGTNK
jgi:DNA replication protein DnaC